MRADALVFAVEGETHCWRDVILSAVQRGDWHVVETRTRQGVASVRHAEASGIAVPAAALEAAGRAFRYAHDLVTAQSMEEWLEHHELSVQDWTAYLRRDLQRARWSADLDNLVARYPITDGEATPLTLAEAICSSELDSWSRVLARRAAAHAFVVANAKSTASPTAPSSVEQLEPLHAVPLSVLWGDEPAKLQATARRLQRLDESLSRFRASVDVLRRGSPQDFHGTRGAHSAARRGQVVEGMNDLRRALGPVRRPFLQAPHDERREARGQGSAPLLDRLGRLGHVRGQQALRRATAERSLPGEQQSSATPTAGGSLHSARSRVRHMRLRRECCLAVVASLPYCHGRTMFAAQGPHDVVRSEA